MKKLPDLSFLLLFITQQINAQFYIPVPTMGYQFDATAGNTTAVATTSEPLDGADVIYSAAYAAIISSFYGLPNTIRLALNKKIIVK